MINCYNYTLIDLKYRVIFSSVFYFLERSSYPVYRCVSMFPYPSGLLHVGHTRLYIINDVISRYSLLKGYNSFMAFGWDSYGLPAEKAAQLSGVIPSFWTRYNIYLMRCQLYSLNLCIDWSKEISSSCSLFSSWTKLLFYIFLVKGIIYIRKSWVNWDPCDNTVLANEQVINGKGWRSNCNVIKRYLSMYFLNVNNIASLLYETTYDLKWDSSVKNSQLSWINFRKCYYYIVIIKSKLFSISIRYPINLFLLSCIYVSVTDVIYDHIYGNVDVNSVTTNSFFKFTGLYASFYFVRKSYIPIYIFSDISFFCNNYVSLFSLNYIVSSNIFFYRYYILYCLYFFVGSCYSINDWCLSRQRVWGTSIPAYLCNRCYNIKVLFFLSYFSKFDICDCFYVDFVTDTLDTFFDSTWYFLLYISLNPFKVDSCNIIDLYLGGKEHSILHLLYVRIVFLYLKLFGIFDWFIPFKYVLCIGLVLFSKYFLSNILVYYSRFDRYICKCCKVFFVNVKMSKSVGNVVNPIDVVKLYGSDVLRMYLLFSTSIYSDIVFNLSKVSGCVKFLLLVWNTFTSFVFNFNMISFKLFNFKSIYIELETLKRIIKLSFRRLYLNRCISLLMTLFNKVRYILLHCYSFSFISYVKDVIIFFMLNFYPFCPSMILVLSYIVPYLRSCFYFK